jgi:hypothetical protein
MTAVAKKEDRKKQKKRLKEDKRAAERRRVLATRERENLYPKILLEPDSGDPEFVSTVANIVRDFDFENPAICSLGKRRLYQMFREVGLFEMIRRLDISMQEASQHGFNKHDVEDAVLGPLLLDLGKWIFARLPDAYRAAPLPFAYYFVYPGDRDLRVYFSFLPSTTSPHGTIYFSPLKPTVAFGGGEWKVGFFRHAIERICERLCPGEEIGYAHFNSCAMYFRACSYYEPLELPDGQHAIRLLQACDAYVDGENDPYVTEVLGLARHPGKSTQLYRVLGYCPVAFVGPRAVAKTFLYPGYRNTPEDQLVRKAPLSREKRQDLLEIASDNRAVKVHRDRGIEAIKWYHDNGVPQVFELDRNIFQPNTN